MLKEIVEVAEVWPGEAVVKFTRQPMCLCCKYASFCNTKGNDTTVINSRGFILQKGDRIEIGIEEKRTVFAACFTFLVPVLIFVAALFIFKPLGEGKSFLVAMMILVFYYYFIRFVFRKKSHYFTARILNKL